MVIVDNFTYCGQNFQLSVDSDTRWIEVYRPERFSITPYSHPSYYSARDAEYQYHSARDAELLALVELGVFREVRLQDVRHQFGRVVHCDFCDFYLPRRPFYGLASRALEWERYYSRYLRHYVDDIAFYTDEGGVDGDVRAWIYSDPESSDDDSSDSTSYPSSDESDLSD